MDTITAPKRDARVRRHEAHGLMLAGLFAIGALCTLVALFISTGATARNAHPAPAAEVAIAAEPQVATSVVVTYYSSVDGHELHYLEYLPAGYNPAVPAPVAILLHGGGGNMYVFDTPPWHAAADTQGFILALAESRTLPCGNNHTLYFDGPIAPGERDILDMVDVVATRHLVDLRRVYLGGFSMGGGGTEGIVARNPGIFAAAAPAAPGSDEFQEWDYMGGGTGCTPATILGGVYGQSPVTDTNWYMISTRFLLPNLMNTPMRIVHGTQDTTNPNSTAIWPYMQSRHVVDTPGFVDSRGRATTLQELHATWPNGYYEEHLWPNAGHTSSLLVPTDTLAFFSAHTLITNPLSVAFTTYEDHHTRAYWLDLHLTQPWTAHPGLVYATRDPVANAVQLQLTGSLTLTLFMAPMVLTSTQPLTVHVQPTGGPLPAGDEALVFVGNWPTGPGWSYTVTREGVPLPSAAYVVAPTRFTLLRRPIDAATYVISATQGGPPTPTPTSCSVQFTDVLQGSTFYPYVRCLACRTIVGGYSTSPPCTTGTPCFLPQNNVTRGQIAKFVSNAANYQDVIPSTRQTFTDVPPSSTFWLYIERAYLHNVISGYTTSPPCTTGVPCFLPQNNVTRGQTAKFVSNAADFQDPIPPNQQTFTDVPPSSTFWLYVERAYLHSVISGYTTSPPCTTGVPCFQGSNSVTRGQTAKFISNAFFPGCITPVR